MEAAVPQHRLFAGGYSDAERAGIFTLAFDETGNGRVVRVNECAPNPSYLALCGSLLFAAHELDGCGRMASYAVGPDGALSCRGACTAPDEAGTCFVLPDPIGGGLFGANYESGSISCCALLPDGRLMAGLPSLHHVGRGPRADRQDGPHVHTLSFVPRTRVLVAVDLGIDALVAYHVEASGAIAPDPVETVRVPAGSGPRMVAYHPSLPLAALVDELADDVLVFRFDAAGTGWRQVARLALPQTPEGDALAAHIAFAPDGRHLYVSVRGANRLVVFPVDEKGCMGRRCDLSSGGRGPRQFALSPDGRFLAVANLESDTVSLFARDEGTGSLQALGHVGVPQVACVIWA